MIRPAETPQPPYYAVIFSSLRSRDDGRDYSQMAERMVELAAAQPGFLGLDSARGDDRFGITVSYWRSLEAIAAWKENAEHQEARRRGREDWYESFRLHIAKVERAYEGP